MAMSKLARARASTAAVRRRARESETQQAFVSMGSSMGYGILRARNVVPAELLGLDTGLVVGGTVAALSMFDAIPARQRGWMLGVASGVSAPSLYNYGFMLAS